MRIEDVDPADVRPAITPRQAASRSGALHVGDPSSGGPQTVRREMAYGRVTRDNPCRPVPTSATPTAPAVHDCRKEIESRLAFVVARHVYGDAGGLILGGQLPSAPEMGTWLTYSIIDATTGEHLVTQVGN